MKKNPQSSEEFEKFFEPSQPKKTVKDLFKEIFDDPVLKNDIDVVQFPEKDTFISSMQKLDKWILRTLLKDPNIKIVKSEIYPYKDYIHIDTLLRKHGKLFIDQLIKKCPIKTDKNSMIDSLAFIIHKRKIDPKSIIGEIPTYKSLWDKISDKSHV